MKIIKLRTACISILAVLVAMLATTIEDVTETNISKHLSSDCVSVADYICNHVEFFTEKYNSCNDADEKFKATSVERKFEITIETVEDEQKGIFLDFNEDNGYAIVVDGYNFYDFEIKGESPYKDIISDQYYYSTICGYYYLMDGEYLNVDESKNGTDLDLNTMYTSAKKYCSITKDEIFNYITEKYGSGYFLYDSQSVPMATGYYTRQWNLTSYYTFEYEEKGVWQRYSEGNCWIVAAYNLLQSLADATGYYKTIVDGFKTDKSKASMPKSSSIVYNYNVKENEPNIYNKYYDCDGNYIGKTITRKGEKHAERILRTDVINFPSLYSEIRKYIDKKYKKTDDGTIYDTMNIIDNIGKQYGYSLNVFGTILHKSYWKGGLIAVSYNLPFIISTSSLSNSSYGSHTMAGCGYRIYKNLFKFSIFQSNKEICFFELRDGHNNTPMYLDVGKYIGLGAIGFINSYNRYTNSKGIKYFTF